MEKKNDNKHNNDNDVIQGLNPDWIFGEKLYAKKFNGIGAIYTFNFKSFQT